MSVRYDPTVAALRRLAEQVERIERSLNLDRLERITSRLEALLSHTALHHVASIRRGHAATLKLLNRDRRELRRQVIELHKLLSKEVDDMKPVIRSNKLVGP